MTSSQHSDLDRFRELVTKAQVPLDLAALTLSGHCQGQALNLDEELAKLDDLAKQVSTRTLRGVVECLFDDLGFAGDELDYFAPRNSYIDQVIENKRGIPISLGVLVIEVARRCSVQVLGVGMPGHFLVREFEDPNSFVNPFTGTMISRHEARELFVRLHPSAEFKDEYLAQVTNQAILSRMLNNLRMIHLKGRSTKKLIPTLELALCFGSPSMAEARQLASALEAVGRTDEAARHMDELAKRSDKHEADEMRALATRLWSRLN
ncbi:MAG: transglutaminase-like domain-containing protein [Actinomycetota bacterium]|nr:transglutaminase-like domain-containing protein [Actinomycetota bacterium]